MGVDSRAWTGAHIALSESGKRNILHTSPTQHPHHSSTLPFFSLGKCLRKNTMKKRKRRRKNMRRKKRQILTSENPCAPRCQRAMETFSKLAKKLRKVSSMNNFENTSTSGGNKGQKKRKS